MQDTEQGRTAASLSIETMGRAERDQVGQRAGVRSSSLAPLSFPPLAFCSSFRVLFSALR